MPLRDWAFRIQDILDAIVKIQRYISSVDFEAFQNDEEIVVAVIRNLTVIGEAANHIPSEVTGRHPDIPWRQMIDLRNFAVHAYWNLRPCAKLADAAGRTPENLSAWTTGGLSPEAANHMIENVIGLHSLPLGIALNFQVNGKDVLVPMTLEEPSVVAGASFMSKLARTGGGFKATTTEPHMIGQMQVLDLQNVHLAQLSLLEHKEELLAEADSVDPVLKKFGGSARNLEARVITDSPIGPFLVVHLIRCP